MSDLREKPSAKSVRHGLIEIAHKRGVKDPLAAQVVEELQRLGEKNIPRVSTAKLYRLEGKWTLDESERIGLELLSDPVVEDVRQETETPVPPTRARRGVPPRSVMVDIWFKPGVTDVVGESVLKGLRDMRIERIQDVRTGTRYRFWGLKNPKAAEKFALEALFNPLIHKRVIHVD